MDEDEKPFPIEYFSILLFLALVNDIAEIICDILDFTGVGLSGEVIMEPANFLFDIFFTGIFIWKVGYGGSTITQYIDDLLEPLLIPGRTLSVWAGMHSANHPDSFLGKIFTQASSIESGDIKGALNKIEDLAEKTAEQAQQQAASAARGNGGNVIDTSTGRPVGEGDQSGEGSENQDNQSPDADGTSEAPKNDPMAPRTEGNPMKNLEGDLLSAGDQSQVPSPKKESTPLDRAA